MSRLLHLAIVQFKPRKGDYRTNLDRLGAIFAQLDTLEPRPEVIQLPETALTGYFVEGAVRDLAMTAGALARDLNACYVAATGGGREVDVCIGFYEVWRDTMHNSMLYATLASSGPTVRHVHRKTFLPTYGLFDEERFVERGHEYRAFDCGWGRAAMLVCEDAWHSISGTIAALDGAQVIFISSAAPARGTWPRDDAVPGPASVARWERLVTDIAEEHGIFVSYANLAGSEGGKLFSGSSSVVGPRGDLRARGPVWDESIVVLSIDLGDLARARADMPLLADLRTALPHLRDNLDALDAGPAGPAEFDPAPAAVTTRAGDTASGTVSGTTLAAGSHTDDRSSDDDIPVMRVESCHHSLPPSLDLDAVLTARWLEHFIREELARRGFDRVVLGLSGGVDSAVVAYLAARALGPDNVVGVRLPYRTSSKESLAHAQLVVDATGIRTHTLDISDAVDGYLRHEPDADAARRGNIMARVRMIALFDLSAKLRAIPIGTGNKTERLFGYFTWHADDSPPVNPLGDLFKTQVWALARHLGVPQAIIGKPPSADLVVGQTDETDFGISYAKADELLNWLLSGYSPTELVARGFDASEVEVVRRRLASTHWKRKLPTVAMLSPSAIGESYLRPVDF